MKWLDPPTFPVSEAEDPLRSLNLPPLIRRILLRRGFTSPEAAQSFLDPRPPAAPEALALPDAARAVERIQHALRRKEQIGIWGDFDVDGQTATALLVETLRALGGEVRYYIPVRATEGHGVHLARLQEFARGLDLLITCDTGITAHAALQWAQQQGLDVIVTDHHDPEPILPPALAIVNPKRAYPDHPLAHLSGAGVAYLLMEALLRTESSVVLQPSDLLDLVALGLIADVAKLEGETRRLVKEGLQALRRTKRPGLRILYEQTRLDPAHITEEHVGFLLAPRLNALGRLSDANPAVEFLTTQDEARARLLARQLESLNLQRQWLTAQVMQTVEMRLKENSDLLESPVLVIENPSWPGGVLGLVAARLVNRYARPVILLTAAEDGLLRGSARSVEGVHITQAIAECADLLHSYGGHPMAAGLALAPQNVQAFRERLSQAIRKQTPTLPEPTLMLDAWVELDEVNLEMAEMLEMLAPFGPGNAYPVLATRGVKIESVTPVGREQEHLRLTVCDARGNRQSLIWWNGNNGEWPQGVIDIAFTARAQDFRGQRTLQLEWIAFRAAPQPLPQVELLPPQVVDWRAQGIPGLPASVPILAEGPDVPAAASVFNRYTLPPAAEIGVYTIPPGPREWRELWQRVRAERVYWLADPPAALRAEAFLERLAGLVKYALRYKGGRATLQELVAATAERELTLRLGLEWLEAGGHVHVEFEEDELRFTPGEGQASPYAQHELFRAIRSLLQETAAYRQLWTRQARLSG